MPDETTNKAPPSATPATPVARVEVQDALDRLREYGTPIVTGIVAALVVAGGIHLYRAHKRSVSDRASTLLSSARTPTQLQEVADAYTTTPAAPIAQIALAADYFARGQYEQAQKAYSRFAEQYPGHPMTVTAEYGLASCLEASGYLDRALEAFNAFSAKYPDHYLAALAQLAKGRVLDQLGRLDEARVVYEDFIAANPESPWVSDAESVLLFVEKELRARSSL